MSVTERSRSQGTADSLTGGVLSRTPEQSYPIGPDPGPAVGDLLAAIGRTLRLQNELLVYLGGLLLLWGLLGIGLFGHAGQRSLGRSGMQAILGGIIVIVPLTAVFRGLTWLATGDVLAQWSAGPAPSIHELLNVGDRFRLLETTAIALEAVGPHWLFDVGLRWRALLASAAVTLGSLTAAVGGLRWLRGHPCLDGLHDGVTLVVVILLFTVILTPIAWLATGAVSPGDSIGSGRTGVITSFESGSMQGWSVESGTASVGTREGDTLALYLQGAVERTFDPISVEDDWVVVAVDIAGPGAVTIQRSGTAVITETVDGDARWRLRAGSPVTIRVAGSGVWLYSVKIRPILTAREVSRNPGPGGSI